jgi:predicted DCC family thiol-disulfide oxidoreductase YuxK
VKPTILYDSDCGFCKWSLHKILAWDRNERLRAVPIQSEEGERLLASIDPEKRLESAHLVTADGRVLSGGAAAPAVLRLLPGGFPLAALTALFPGATDRSYRWVARNRSRISQTLRINRGRR